MLISRQMCLHIRNCLLHPLENCILKYFEFLKNNLILTHKVVSPIPVRISSYTQNILRSCLPPHSIWSVSVDESIWIYHGENIPIVFSQNPSIWICQDFIDEPCCCSTCNPFASMNIGFNHNRFEVLRK